MYTISQLFIYPVKSLGGFEVPAAQLTDKGFEHDRRWMVVDKNNEFLTQREYPQMSLLQTLIIGDELVIYHKNDPTDKTTIALKVTPAPTVKVKVLEDECTAQFVSDAADKWLSTQLGMACRIVFMPDSELRKVDDRYAHNEEVTNFSDGYPLTMIGQASLDDLNSRLLEPLPMNRFRPNIVFTGDPPFEEDTMEHLTINGINMYGVKLCSRCVVTTIDQNTASKAKEPLKTLAGYRMKNNKIYFGQNLLFNQTGNIKVGDNLEVIKRKLPVFMKESSQ